MATTRKDKIVMLKQMYDLETGVRNKEAFHVVDSLFQKAAKKKALDGDIRSCRLCPGMNQVNMTEAAVGYGYLNAKIMLVGQSLCTACMNTGIPFTRGSGYLLDAALKVAGFRRKDIFITNIVHCHPQSNRKSDPKEVRNCIQYVKRELHLVDPELVITLGVDAKEAFAKIKTVAKVYNAKHPAYFLHAGFEGAVDWIVNMAAKMEKYQ